MEYFNLLEFKKEPFSNSPEPEFFFASVQQSTCLQMLELAVRLRRGLNIVIGAVGTGKTTLCRKLLQNLSLPAASDSPPIDTFLLLDPAVASRLEFVKTVAGILGISDISIDDNEWQIKEKIKGFLFDQGVQEQKIVVLVIDEGQKIPDECLEVLREFLNYETNSFKLLQIVIFAQPELRKSLAARANLLDRVNYLYHLQPLKFRQMKAMIEHRICVASQDPARNSLFTLGGMLAVYLATAGYPRKVVSLCHQVILMMIIRGKSQAGWFLMRSCISKMAGSSFRRITWATLSLLILSVLFFSAVFYWNKQPAANNQLKHQRTLSGINIEKEFFFSPTQQVPGEDQKKMRDDLGTLSGINIEKEFIFPTTQQKLGEDQERMPDDLGTLAVKKGMTIWGVLENIYGDSGAEIQQRFMDANPQIKDINAITEGAVIRLPAIPAKAQTLKKDIILVALGNSKDLVSLYDSFFEKKSQGRLPSLLFLSFWNQQKGRQFAIALDKRFTRTEEARGAIQQLPPELAASAYVLSTEDGNAVFFNRRLSGN